MVWRREDYVWEVREKLVSFHLPIRKIRHRDSGWSIGQDHFMNQEWYCTSEAIAQIMIVFIVLIYDELKTQIWCFVNVAVTRLFSTTICRQAHWTIW